MQSPHKNTIPETQLPIIIIINLYINIEWNSKLTLLLILFIQASFANFFLQILRDVIFNMPHKIK